MNTLYTTTPKIVHRYSSPIFGAGYLWLLCLGLSTSVWSQVKIGDRPEDIHPQAVLELESTDKGLLIPRMTTEQRDRAFSISSTPAGMLIFNTNLQELQILGDHRTPDGKTQKAWGSYRVAYSNSERPQNPYMGELIFNTKKQQLEYFNGQSWEPVSGVNSLFTALIRMILPKNYPLI